MLTRHSQQVVPARRADTRRARFGAQAIATGARALDGQFFRI